ncbi:MAG: BatD family protein, partial [Acidobacteriota bacterium]|nr:BatD family protein [Acidobacteriota bacterium]
MTRRATLIAAYGLSLLVPTGVALPAQDVDVRAYLDNHEIGVGQQFILNVEVSGTQQIDGEPELPDLTAFAIYRGSGTTSSMQMVNGRTSVSLIIQYRYLATEKGTFEIPPITVRTAGQSLTTEPLSLTVSDTPPPAAGSRPGGDPQIGPEDLFVEADVTGVRVWENQPVIVEYRLFTAVSVSSYNVVRLPATTGFWVEQYDLGDPRVEEIVRNGENYATVLIRKVALFPTGAGTRTIEPLTIEAQVRVRRARDPFESILGRDPLFGRDSLFASIVPVVAATEPIEVEVRPLPTEGRPANFTGFVGQLSLDAELDRDTASVNDAVTLRVEMSGVGNLRGLPEPAIDLPPGFEVFPPEIRDEIALGARGATGSRTFEYVLIPRAPGAQTIPSIHVSYFDPDTEQYRVATATALTLEVTGEATPTAPGDVPRRTGVDQLRT